MFSSLTNNGQQPCVTAQFHDGKHSFVISEGATFGELAGRVDDLSAWHGHAPITIHVQLNTAKLRPRMAITPRQLISH